MFHKPEHIFNNLYIFCGRPTEKCYHANIRKGTSKIALKVMNLCCLASIRNRLILACQIGYIKVFSQCGGHTRNTTFDSLDYLLSSDVIMHFFFGYKEV